MKPANIQWKDNREERVEWIYGYRGFARDIKGPEEGDNRGRAYVSPEWRTLQSGAAEAADVFALGAISLHSACLWLPYGFSTNFTPSLSACIRRNVANLNYSHSFKQLLSRMLEINPGKRISMREVVSEAMKCSLNLTEKASGGRNIQLTLSRIAPISITNNELTDKMLLEKISNARKSGKIEKLEHMYLTLLQLHLVRNEDEKAKTVAYEALSVWKNLHKSSNYRLSPYYQSIINLFLTRNLYHLAKQLTGAALTYLQRQRTRTGLDLIYCYKQLAILNIQLGEGAEAYRSACLCLQKIGDQRSRDIVEMMVITAKACSMLGKVSEAAQWARKALVLQETVDETALAPILSLLISLTRILLRYDECSLYYLRMIAITEELEPTANLDSMYQEFSSICLNCRAYFDLEKLLRNLICKNQTPKIWWFDVLAICCYKQKQYLAAEEYHLRALELKNNSGENSMKIRQNLKGLIKARIKLGKVEEFGEICRHYVSTFEECDGEESASTRNSLQFVQKCAEQANLHLLSDEFRLKRDRYAGKKISLIAVAKNYYAQKEFALLETACHEAMSQVEDLNPDYAEINFMLAECYQAFPHRANRAIKTCKKAALNSLSFKMKSLDTYQYCFNRSCQENSYRAKRIRSIVEKSPRKTENWDELLLLASTFPPPRALVPVKQLFDDILKVHSALCILARALQLQKNLLQEETGDSAAVQKANRDYCSVVEVMKRMPRLTQIKSPVMRVIWSWRKFSAPWEGLDQQLQ